MAGRPTHNFQTSNLYPKLDDELQESLKQTKTIASVNQKNILKDGCKSSCECSPTECTKTCRKRLHSDKSKLPDEVEGDSIPPLSDKEESGTGGLNLYYAFLFVLLALIVFLAPRISYVSNDIINSSSDILNANKAEELYELEDKFPTQPQYLWSTIVSGIKNLYSSDPQQPCILLLLLNEDDVADKSLQQETGECIARLVAKRVVKHMSSESGPAVLDASTVTASDYGDTLQFLAKKISSQKALVITNLQELSGSMAQSLHVLCDRYNPMVRDALVVFTLKSKKRGSDENVASFVQRTLMKLWEKDVPPDKLPALVTRIAGSVVSVITEKTLPSDCMFP